LNLLTSIPRRRTPFARRPILKRPVAMSKIAGNEIRPGAMIEHQGALWIAVKTQAVKPGKGGAYNQVELKNIETGTKLNERFRSSEMVE
jgi:elongation factor P